MENKYYTPTIEEFHVGFEYEFRHSDYKEDGWIKFNTPEFNYESGNSHLSRTNLSEFRVKYLDREDIESLGWEHDQTTKDGAVFYIGSIMTEKEWMLTCFNAILRKGEDYTNISIIDVNDKYGQSGSFQGTIKNKSELKKLMQQLAIN